MTFEESLLGHVREFHVDLGVSPSGHRTYEMIILPRIRLYRAGLGKSSPEEILAAATYIHHTYPGIYGEAIRAKLIDGSLIAKEFNYKGIDCSGFIYYVLDRTYLDTLGKSLMSDLSVPKEHVLNGARNLDEWKVAYELSDSEAATLADDVPMTWVVDTFKRKPVNLCRVAGLTSDYSSVEVELKNARIGDIVSMKREDDPIPHAGIITSVDKHQLRSLTQEELIRKILVECVRNRPYS